MALIPDEAQPMTLGDYFQQGQSPASVVGEAAAAPLVSAPEEQLPANVGLGAQLAQVQAEQVRSLREHAQFSQGLQAQQDQVNLRSTDLELGAPILAALDSRTERVVRRAILTELSASVGLDTNGAGNKQRIALLTALSPDTLSDVSQFLSRKLNTIEPGGGAQFTKGFLSGQIPLMPILAEMRTTARQQPTGGREAVYAAHGPPSGLGGDSAVQAAPTATAVPPPGVDPGASAIAADAAVREGTLPIHERQVPPTYLRVLGLDPSRPLTVGEVTAQGFRVPQTAAEMERQANEIIQLQSAPLQMMLLSAQMELEVRGRPEALNFNFENLVDFSNPSRWLTETGAKRYELDRRYLAGERSKRFLMKRPARSKMQPHVILASKVG